jgi:hypothetical protein
MVNVRHRIEKIIIAQSREIPKRLSMPLFTPDLYDEGRSVDRRGGVMFRGGGRPFLFQQGCKAGSLLKLDATPRLPLPTKQSIA